jgi:hypothetical protein
MEDSAVCSTYLPLQPKSAELCAASIRADSTVWREAINRFCRLRPAWIRFHKNHGSILISSVPHILQTNSSSNAELHIHCGWCWFASIIQSTQHYIFPSILHACSLMLSNKRLIKLQLGVGDKVVDDKVEGTQM